jgi:hypothetical protein
MARPRKPRETKMPNSELMKAAQEAARAVAIRNVLEKDAVVPPAPGGDPAAMAGGGMPPGGAPPGAMPPGGAPPPGMDPAMMGGGGTDPALAAAGGGAPDQIRQMVQQELMAQGGKPGGGAGPGKAGKPDVAVELAKLNDLVYKIGMMVTALGNKLEVEFPVSTLLGPAPGTSDPALAQDANTVPAAVGGPGGAPPAGGDPSGGGQPPFPPIQQLSGNPADGGQKVASLAELNKVAAELAAFTGLVDEASPDDDWLSELVNIQKVASPDPVGSVFNPNPAPASVYHTSPLSIAAKMRQKVRGH